MTIEQQIAGLTPAQLQAAAVLFHRRARDEGLTDAQIDRVLNPTIGDVLNAKRAATQSKPVEETALDAFERLGLVGCISDGPADLATNPKHMEGFGQDDPFSSR